MYHSEKEVNLSILHPKEEKEMTQFFHIKIQVKKTKINTLFGSGSQEKLIAQDLVCNIRLEVHDNPSNNPLGWVNKDALLRVMKTVQDRVFHKSGVC